MCNKYESHIIWPTGTYPEINDHTFGTHATEEQAQTRCDLAYEKGAGGEGKVFPVSAYVFWPKEMIPAEKVQDEIINLELKAALACVRQNSLLGIVAKHVDELQEELKRAKIEAAWMRKDAGDAERRVKCAEDIQHAEKLILLQEIEAHTETKRQLGELLAVIHRDGGQHQAQHGTEKSVEDAIAAVQELVLQARQKSATPIVHPDTQRLDHILQNLCGWEFNSLAADPAVARDTIDKYIKEYVKP